MAKVISFAAGFLVAMVIAVWLSSNRIRRARRKRKQELEKHPERKVQATKVIVFSIMLTYHLAFILGAWVVIFKDIYQITTLLTYTGGVCIFAVAFYCWKSKAENLLKIKKNNPDLVASLNDFSSMSSQ